jgi:hypothetical protein
MAIEGVGRNSSGSQFLNFDALRRQAVSTRGGVVLRMIEHGLTTRQRAGFETLAQAPCRAASGFGQHSRGLIVAAHAPLSGKCRIIDVMENRGLWRRETNG